MIENILDNFCVDGKLIRYGEFGGGHINTTYLAEMEIGGGVKKYILRKINSSVFHSPRVTAENAVNVAIHIRDKLVSLQADNIYSKVLTFIKTKSGGYYYEDNSGEIWTLNLFIENAHTLNYVENEEQAFAAAKAFGNFVKLLLDFDPSLLKPSIPGFHDWQQRMGNFNNAISSPTERTETAKKEIEYLNNNNLENIITEVSKLIDEKILPQRVTHNDTKISNVMLSEIDNEPLAVIDLDTVMPGLIIYDFGDMVRSFCSSAAEDYHNPEEITLRINIFRALSEGFISEVKEFITQKEFDNLILGAKLIIYIQAIRFLTDYLENDIYYRTEYGEHNLIRAKNQISLLRSFLDKEIYLKEIIEEIKAQYRSEQ